jgi:hypothetical protein
MHQTTIKSSAENIRSTIFKVLTGIQVQALLLLVVQVVQVKNAVLRNVTQDLSLTCILAAASENAKRPLKTAKIQLIHFLTKINVNAIATLYQLTAQIQTSLTF